MRPTLVAIALLAVAARGSCGNGGYDPCGGKACGEACTLCEPGARDCAETAVVKACDPAGRCVAAGPDLGCAHPDCAGKLCGDACNPCGPDRMCPTLIASACDRHGGCAGLVAGLCDGECAGKTCGAPCRPPGCALGTSCLVPWACDGGGACVELAALTCPAR
jgi:hypothetical protein